MNYQELLKKEFYIIKCKDFTYYVQPVHIIGIGGDSSDEELYYYLDTKDIMGKDEEMYMYQLEQYKTYEEAQKEVDRLNNIPSNKERAKQWNTRDKFMVRSFVKSHMNNGNSICVHQDIESCTYKINYKSKMVVGNVTIMLEKQFNWFNRLMFKLVFGIKIENIKENK